MWILQSSFIIYLQRENFDFRWCINFFLHFSPPSSSLAHCSFLHIPLSFILLSLPTMHLSVRWNWLSGILRVRRTMTGWDLSPIQTLMSSSCASPLTALTAWVSKNYTHTSTRIQAWQGIPHRRLFHVVPHLSVFTKEVISALCRMCGHSVVALNANCRGTAYICTYTQWNFFLSWCLWAALP